MGGDPVADLALRDRSASSVLRLPDRVRSSLERLERQQARVAPAGLETAAHESRCRLALLDPPGAQDALQRPDDRCPPVRAGALAGARVSAPSEQAGLEVDVQPIEVPDLVSAPASVACKRERHAVPERQGIEQRRDLCGCGGPVARLLLHRRHPDRGSDRRGVANVPVDRVGVERSQRMHDRADSAARDVLVDHEVDKALDVPTTHRVEALGPQLRNDPRPERALQVAQGVRLVGGALLRQRATRARRSLELVHRVLHSTSRGANGAAVADRPELVGPPRAGGVGGRVRRRGDLATGVAVVDAGDVGRPAGAPSVVEGRAALAVPHPHAVVAGLHLSGHCAIFAHAAPACSWLSRAHFLSPATG